MRISFLTPRLTTTTCGLADHTCLLAENLAQQGVETVFLACSPIPSQTQALVAEYWDRKTQPLWQCVDRQQPDWLWVQLSGYGYSNWGAPYHLGKSLQQVRARCPRVKIAVCLHEVHCRPGQLGWKKVWLSYWQRLTVGKIARLADLVFPTILLWQKYALEQYGVDPTRVFRLPIGSNIPASPLTSAERAELRRQLGWREEDVTAIAFGSYATQRFALERFEPLISEGFRRGQLHRLVCLGGDTLEIPSDLAHWKNRWGSTVSILGPQSADRVSALLACGDFGLAPTPLDMLEKSGSFMAFAEAGLAVLTLPAYQDATSVNPELPILPAQTWDWSQARSPHVAQIGRDLRKYAATHYSWKRIATRALEQLSKFAMANC